MPARVLACLSTFLGRRDDAIFGTPPTYRGECQFDAGPLGFNHQRDGVDLCGVGPHRRTFLRNAGSRDFVRVICDALSGRCGMTLYEDAPPLQFAVSLAMGDARPEHWQTREARVRGFVSDNVVADADCRRWWPLLRATGLGRGGPACRRQREKRTSRRHRPSVAMVLPSSLGGDRCGRVRLDGTAALGARN